MAARVPPCLHITINFKGMVRGGHPAGGAEKMVELFDGLRGLGWYRVMRAQSGIGLN
jgi:hypothetical protein